MLEVKVIFTGTSGKTSLTCSWIFVIDVTARGTVVPKLAKIIATLPASPVVMLWSPASSKDDKIKINTIKAVAVVRLFLGILNLLKSF
jgi:hypothetical protein